MTNISNAADISDPRSDARDLYKQEVLATFRPGEYSYPPAPPKGLYSTRHTQGLDDPDFVLA